MIQITIILLMNSNQGQYSSLYQQIKLLGRGNYGSAYLVKDKKSNNFYVAKKMMLEGLSQKQIAAAWIEIDILKKFQKLHSPFIVEYQRSFHFENTLIIIMEYCQHGDLANYIKNWKKKQQLLSEKVIANWFIQLLYGVKILHSKNILHRDLKSANVFLTSNRTIKIGDFGISKILQSTSANTFIGTPYYLSPEVCDNKPYNLQSDIWSLGVIIYQLCTMNYPFQSTNLIGLAMKILKDEVKQIPNNYSKELNDIIMKLFIKDQKKRITIDEILNTAYMKKCLATFDVDQSNFSSLKLSIRRIPQTQISTMKSSTSNEDTMKTINSKFQNTLNNDDTLNYSSTLDAKKQKELRKQRQIATRQRQLNNATLQTQKDRLLAMKFKEQNEGNSETAKQIDKKKMAIEIKNYNKNQAQELCQKTKNFSKIQKIDISQLNHTSIIGKAQKFQEIQLPSQTQHIAFVPLKSHKSEDQYYDQDLEEYYDDDFEEYNEQTTKLSDKNQLEDVKAYYVYEVQSQTLSLQKKLQIKNAFKYDDVIVSNPSLKLKNKQQEFISRVGEERYHELYTIVNTNKLNHKTLKNDYKKHQLEVIYYIEQIVYQQNS